MHTTIQMFKVSKIFKLLYIFKEINARMQIDENWQ